VVVEEVVVLEVVVLAVVVAAVLEDLEVVQGVAVAQVEVGKNPT
jgi:hypothetical protein